jgi:hypothetical protein
VTTAHGIRDDGAWTWPCPYCRAPNELEAAVCGGCGAQLRDPDEDDLFTTVATDNAQMVDPDAPRVKESLWSTEALPDEEVAEEVESPEEPPAPPAGGARPGPQEAPSKGPFSAEASSGGDRHGNGSSVFGAGEPADAPRPAGAGPFGTPGFASTAPPVAPQQPAAAAWGAAPGPPVAPPVAPPPAATTGPPPAATPPQAEGEGSPRPTPDEHGLSVAVDALEPRDRDRCATPIAVCGALLGDQEVVLALVAGHLLGHPAVVALTSTRVLVANARRWKPLVDQFLPGPDLMVHLRHDRDVASLTFVQGDRLTGVDDITDVTAAVDLAERIRAVAARGAKG